MALSEMREIPCPNATCEGRSKSANAAQIVPLFAPPPPSRPSRLSIREETRNKYNKGVEIFFYFLVTFACHFGVALVVVSCRRIEKWHDSMHREYLGMSRIAC